MGVCRGLSLARVKSTAHALLLILVFLLSNVVAAGVVLVLWPLAKALPHDWLLPAAFAVGLVAVVCACLFVLGALRHLPRFFR
jgi:hypothetical protein